MAIKAEHIIKIQWKFQQGYIFVSRIQNYVYFSLNFFIKDLKILWFKFGKSLLVLEVFAENVIFDRILTHLPKTYLNSNKNCFQFILHFNLQVVANLQPWNIDCPVRYSIKEQFLG